MAQRSPEEVFGLRAYPKYPNTNSAMLSESYSAALRDGPLNTLKWGQSTCRITMSSDVLLRPDLSLWDLLCVLGDGSSESDELSA